MAYQKSIGSDGGTNGTGWTGYTVILRTAPGGSDPKMPGRGIVKEFNVWVYVWGGTPSVKCKIFRDDGTYWVFKGQTPLITVVQGFNIIPAWIPVEKGDYMAIYYQSGQSIGNRYENGNAGDNHYRFEDVQTTYLKSAWTQANIQRHSGLAKIFAKGILL